MEAAFIAQECYIAVKNRDRSLWKTEQQDRVRATVKRRYGILREIRDNVRQTIWQARVKQVQGAQAKTSDRKPGSKLLQTAFKTLASTRRTSILQLRG
jgi:hypothetical protein